MMIRKLKTKDKKYTVSEGNGFSIRVSKSGTKWWFYVYEFEGKKYEVGIGNYPEMSLEDSRYKFQELRRLVKSGINVKEEQKRESNLRKQTLTVKELIGEYIEKHSKIFKKNWEEDKRILEKDVLPLWGNKKVTDITRRDVISLLEGVIERGSPSMSNQLLKIVRKMFNFGVDREILQISPCNKVKSLSPNNMRTRTLSESELKIFFKNIDSTCMTDSLKRILKLILFTGQRPGEVSGIHTREIEGDWWIIPEERSKNKKIHHVYLSSSSKEIIKESITNIVLSRELPIDEEYEGYIFPCPHKDKEKPIDSHALAVAVRRNFMIEKKEIKTVGRRKIEETKILNMFGLDKFTPHDLRRTSATYLASIGYSDEIIDSILNHKKQGIIRTYNVYDYKQEKENGMKSLEQKILGIIDQTPYLFDI